MKCIVIIGGYNISIVKATKRNLASAGDFKRKYILHNSVVAARKDAALIAEKRRRGVVDWIEIENEANRRHRSGFHYAQDL